MSTDYIKSYFVLSNSQINKIKSAIRNGVDTTIQVQRGYVVNKAASNATLNLTKRQVNKITSIPTSDPYKGFRIHLSKTQLQNQPFFEDTLNPKIRKVDFGDTSSDESMDDFDSISEQLSKNVKELSLSVTPAQKAVINTEIVKLMTLRDMTEKDFQSGEGLGALIKLAIPFIKTVLPKIIGTLGLAAATGAITGATHKATSGKGFKRAGGNITFNKPDMLKLLKIANRGLYDRIMPQSLSGRINRDLKIQSGGFIGTLLAGLAGSLLPMLIGGKGFKRAGSKDWLGKALTNFDIDKYFGFRVHYPRDKLVEKLKDGSIFIINTDEAIGSGKHFVALKNINDCTMYFDSFGAVPLPEALKLSKTKNDEIIHNTYRIQAFDSVKCGYFCIDFLNNVTDYSSYNDWLLNYSPNDFKANDNIVMKRLNLI